MFNVVAFLTVFTLLAWGAPGTASSQTLQIKVGAATATDHAPVFVAVERGIFPKHGLDAKVNMFETGQENINNLLSGNQDLYVGGTVPFLVGVSNGMPLMLIGHLHGDPNRTEYADNESIVAGPKAGIKVGDIKALKGKRIGTVQGSGAEAYVVGMLTQNGMKASDVTLRNLKPSELVTALRTEQVDAITIWEPWGSTAITQVPGSVRVSAGGCQSCYDPGVIITTRKVIAEKPEVLRRFMVAFAEAQQWARQNFDAAAEINVRWIPGVDLATMKLAIRNSVFDHRMSQYTRDMYAEKEIPYLVREKRVNKPYDPATVIDAQFYLYAEKTAPQFYADLPRIPDAIRLK